MNKIDEIYEHFGRCKCHCHEKGVVYGSVLQVRLKLTNVLNLKG